MLVSLITEARCYSQRLFNREYHESQVELEMLTFWLSDKYTVALKDTWMYSYLIWPCIQIPCIKNT